MKTICLSALNVPEQTVRELMKKLQTYGISSAAHQWQDDNRGMPWLGARDELCNPQCAFWGIMGSREALLAPETRYGLSILALCVQAQRGSGFPVVILQTDKELLSAADLPTPLQHAVVLYVGDAGTPAKLVARLHSKNPDLPLAYQFDMVGNQQFGQWFEVRPTRDEWQGVIFGVNEGEIKFQAVGPRGQLPKNSTLNYPMQGLQVEYGGRTFSAWAVRNPITTESSYYVKVEGYPKSILFGAFSDQDETEMYRIELK